MDVRDRTFSRPGEGFLAALGYLQIGTGGLSLTMSLMALCQVLAGHSDVLNPALALGSHAAFLDTAIGAYVSFQLSIGWIAGALQLIAGWCCVSGRAPRFVAVANFVSLANFPHGTVAAVLVVLSLRRAEIAQAFRREAKVSRV